jgi:hypothetical protein
LTGAVVIVVLTACFPQDRTLFLVALALWAAACALVATLLSIVLARTGFGGPQRRLAALFVALSAETTGRFTSMLALAGRSCQRRSLLGAG